MLKMKKQEKDVTITGISGSKLNLNGSSKRANSQVNKWNWDAGYVKYAARVVKINFSRRQAALNWERLNTSRLKALGNSMGRHIRPY